MGYKLGTTSKNNLKLILPELKEVVTTAIAITEQDFMVYAGARTAKEQNRLYQIGRRGIKGERTVTSKDGYKNKSNHQVHADGYGRAVDLVPYVGGPVWKWDLIFDMAAWVALAAVSCDALDKIRWGGNWYQTMDQYVIPSSDVSQTRASLVRGVEWYKAAHPGSDFLDGPHFEWVG